LYRIGKLTKLLEPAIVISLVGFVESVVISKTYSIKYKYQVSANRELVALGFSNLISSFFQSYPAFGSLPRSRVNDLAGARTQMAGIITSFLVLIIILTIAEVFYFLPKVMMAAIIISAVINLLEFEDIIFLYRVHAYKEIALLIAIFLVTLILGSEVGILVAILLSLLLVVKKTTVPHALVLGIVPDTEKFKDISTFPEAKTIPGVIIVRIEESLTFANIGQIKQMFTRLEGLGSHKIHPADKVFKVAPLKGIIIDAKNIPHIDPSALQILVEMCEDYEKREILVCFVKLKEHHQKGFLLSGLMKMIGPKNFFKKTIEALNYINNKKGMKNSGATKHEL